MTYDDAQIEKNYKIQFRSVAQTQLLMIVDETWFNMQEIELAVDRLEDCVLVKEPRIEGQMMKAYL